MWWCASRVRVSVSASLCALLRCSKGVSGKTSWISRDIMVRVPLGMRWSPGTDGCVIERILLGCGLIFSCGCGMLVV